MKYWKLKRRIILLAGPSCCGKDTQRGLLAKDSRIIELGHEIVPVISDATRLPRLGEVQGIDYNFQTPFTFLRRHLQGEHLEAAEGHLNDFYALPKAPFENLTENQIIIKDINVDGIDAVMRWSEDKDPEMRPIVIFSDIPDNVIRERSARNPKVTEDDIVKRIHSAIRERLWLEKNLHTYGIYNIGGTLTREQITDGIVTHFLNSAL